jgi:hypothetical protein
MELIHKFRSTARSYIRARCRATCYNLKTRCDPEHACARRTEQSVAAVRRASPSAIRHRTDPEGYERRDAYFRALFLTRTQRVTHANDTHCSAPRCLPAPTVDSRKPDQDGSFDEGERASALWRRQLWLTTFFMTEEGRGGSSRWTHVDRQQALAWHKAFATTQRCPRRPRCRSRRTVRQHRATKGEAGYRADRLLARTGLP